MIAVLLPFGVTHRNSEAVVMRRCSWAHAGVLQTLTALASFLIWVLVHPHTRVADAFRNAYALLLALAASILVLEIGLGAINPRGVEMLHWLPYHMQGMLDDPNIGHVSRRSTFYILGPVGASRKERRSPTR